MDQLSISKRLICGVALLWCAVTASAAIPSSERDVLLALYADAGGPNWTNSSNWNGQAGSECTWFGVTCDGSQTHVLNIALAGNNVAGSLPALAPLTQLQNVDVSNNHLSGSIPPLSTLTSLQNFYAFGNQLTGSIPEIANLTQLGYFYVYDNQLTGALPDLSNMPTLCHFNVSNNQLTGSVPALTQLSSLVLFDVSKNQLSGGLPSLTGLSSLSIFAVGDNRITGNVPAAPSPNSLVPGVSSLCPNLLTRTANATWNGATGYSPWWAAPSPSNLCDEVFLGSFE